MRNAVFAALTEVGSSDVPAGSDSFLSTLSVVGVVILFVAVLVAITYSMYRSIRRGVKDGMRDGDRSTRNGDE